MKRAWIVVLIAILLALAALPLAKGNGPKIARGLDCENWRNCADASRKFNTALNKRFPVGSDAKILRSVLLGQGFRQLPSSIVRCLKDKEFGPVGELVIQCPSWDQNWNPRNELVYDWGWLLCGKEVGAGWSEDNEGRLTHLEGFVEMSCL